MRLRDGVSDAAAIAEAAARSDGGGRWRVHGTKAVPAGAGNARLKRVGLPAEGVELPPRGGYE